MRRRTFIAGSAALLAGPHIARGQGTTTKRLAILHTSAALSSITASGDVRYKALFEELTNLGYVEGQNLTVLRYSAEGHQNKYMEVARQAVDAAPDVVLGIGLMAPAYQSLPTTIPLVFVFSDPVAAGLVASLAHPGGHFTGVSTDAGLGILGKRLSVLREVVPRLSKPYYLTLKFDWEAAGGAAIRSAADELGLSISAIPIDGEVNENVYARVFTAMRAAGADGLVVAVTSEISTFSRSVVSLANQFKLPAVYPYRSYVLEGGLISYGSTPEELYSLAARQIASILRGMKPADLPVLQPTKIELIVNVKAARAIGLTLPQTLLLTADEVIE